MAVSCNTENVFSPNIRFSSVLYRTSAEGVKDTITFSDSLHIGDTVYLPMILDGYYDYLISFTAQADSDKVKVSFPCDDEFRKYLASSSDLEHGKMVFLPDQVYACYITFAYVPVKSGTHRIDFLLESSARDPYSEWSGHFEIGVK